MVMGKMLETFYKPQGSEISGQQETVQQVERPQKSKRNENVTRIMQYLQEKADKMPAMDTMPEAPAQEVYMEAA